MHWIISVMLISLLSLAVAFVVSEAIVRRIGRNKAGWRELHLAEQREDQLRAEMACWDPMER